MKTYDFEVIFKWNLKKIQKFHLDMRLAYSSQTYSMSKKNWKDLDQFSSDSTGQMWPKTAVSKKVCKE